MATVGPQNSTQLHTTTTHQKRFSRMENEPETPVPTSYSPGITLSNDVEKSSYINSIESKLDQSMRKNLGSLINEQGYEPTSPSPPHPFQKPTSLQEATPQQQQQQYLPDITSSPTKMNQLQNLMSSLQKIMDDQTFASTDLRSQLNELQDALIRISSKEENMTPEERKTVQNAQIMMGLAEEVIATNLAPQSKKPIQDAQPISLPLTLSMPRSMDLTETPPPSAVTPPPGSTFSKGHLRHRSSTTSFSSSVNSDRQYTQDGEERFSRPSSSASSYRTANRKKSRQFDSVSKRPSSRQDAESNQQFDRICSILSELITDASTAVSTAPDGSQQPTDIPLPQFEPLVHSESDFSADSASDQDDDAEDTTSTIYDAEDTTITTTTARPTSPSKSIDDPFLKRLQGPERSRRGDDEGVEVELEPADRFRTGFRTRMDKPTKRLSSLFAELQSTQPVLDVSTKDNSLEKELSKDKSIRKPRHSTSSLSLSSTRSSRHNSVSLTGKSLESELNDSPPDSPLVTRKLHQRNSISSFRSGPENNGGLEPQVVDKELEQTVETIDGLTRDLVAVATHQNMMQMKLQKTLQFQKQQIQQIELAHSSADLISPITGEHSELEKDQQNPLADLSRSLKQVAVSVGKILAANASNAHRDNKSKEGGAAGRKEISDGTTTPSAATKSVEPSSGRNNTRLSGKDFSRYFQELEKLAALGGKIGIRHGKSGSEGSDDQSDVSSIRGDLSSTSSSRRGSTSAVPPPELQDFAAQCRLLTRALVLPFIQLTHHAMTSQDSAFALHPRNGKLSNNSANDLDSTLKFVEELSAGQDITANSPKLKPQTQATATSTFKFPSSVPISGRDLESIIRTHTKEMSIVKAKTFVSTGLYLLHLIYWTVLFVVGTVVLDPWLAETAGLQVVRVVDQVREAIAKEDPTGRKLQNGPVPFQLQSSETVFAAALDQLAATTELQQQQQQNLKQFESEESEPLLQDGKLQAHEDRAIEVAVGFETLKHKLSGSRLGINSQTFKGMWNGRQSSFETTAAALSEATLGDNSATTTTTTTTLESAIESSPSSPATKATKADVLKGVSWLGPRKRRPTRDGTSTARVRRFSNTRIMSLAGPLKPELVPSGRRERPVSHWGSFGMTMTNDSEVARPGMARSFTLSGLGPEVNTLQTPQLQLTSNIVPAYTQARRKSF
ncbi:hypothetical protein BGZ76_001452 [Entomortierella beljakovae]|nr:hypothetical protein BGZ76_001452 [Entomortierella beljakovae]